MRAPSPFAAGTDAGKVNVAVQRPTVNVREAENVGEQLAGELRQNQTPRMSRHGLFGPTTVTHPGLE